MRLREMVNALIMERILQEKEAVCVLRGFGRSIQSFIKESDRVKKGSNKLKTDVSRENGSKSRERVIGG